MHLICGSWRDAAAGAHLLPAALGKAAHVLAQARRRVTSHTVSFHPVLVPSIFDSVDYWPLVLFRKCQTVVCSLKLSCFCCSETEIDATDHITLSFGIPSQTCTAPICFVALLVLELFHNLLLTEVWSPDQCQN